MRVLSVKEAADQADLSPRHYWRLIANGEGPVIVRNGRRVGVIDTDNEVWIRAHREDPRQPSAVALEEPVK